MNWKKLKVTENSELEKLKVRKEVEKIKEQNCLLVADKKIERGKQQTMKIKLEIENFHSYKSKQIFGHQRLKKSFPLEHV